MVEFDPGSSTIPGPTIGLVPFGLSRGLTVVLPMAREVVVEWPEWTGNGATDGEASGLSVGLNADK